MYFVKRIKFLFFPFLQGQRKSKSRYRILKLVIQKSYDTKYRWQHCTFELKQKNYINVYPYNNNTQVSLYKILFTKKYLLCDLVQIKSLHPLQFSWAKYRCMQRWFINMGVHIFIVQCHAPLGDEFLRALCAIIWFLSSM